MSYEFISKFNLEQEVIFRINPKDEGFQAEIKNITITNFGKTLYDLIVFDDENNPTVIKNVDSALVYSE